MDTIMEFLWVIENVSKSLSTSFALRQYVPHVLLS